MQFYHQKVVKAVKKPSLSAAEKWKKTLREEMTRISVPRNSVSYKTLTNAFEELHLAGESAVKDIIAKHAVVVHDYTVKIESLTAQLEETRSILWRTESELARTKVERNDLLNAHEKGKDNKREKIEEMKKDLEKMTSIAHRATKRLKIALEKISSDGRKICFLKARLANQGIDLLESAGRNDKVVERMDNVDTEKEVLPSIYARKVMQNAAISEQRLNNFFKQNQHLSDLNPKFQPIRTDSKQIKDSVNKILKFHDKKVKAVVNSEHSSTNFSIDFMKTKDADEFTVRNEAAVVIQNAVRHQLAAKHEEKMKSGK
eukprot:g1330.t1